MRMRLWHMSDAEGECGQATVEYALVLCAFLATVVALGVMWHAVRDGALLRRCMEALSHRFAASGAIGSAQDVSLY